jgi:hypothetical protein
MHSSGLHKVNSKSVVMFYFDVLFESEIVIHFHNLYCSMLVAGHNIWIDNWIY